VDKLPVIIDKKEQMDDVDKALKRYYAAAQTLYLDDIKPNSTKMFMPSSLEDIGESLRFGGRRRKSKAAFDASCGKDIKCLESSLRRRSITSPAYHMHRVVANAKCGGCLSMAEAKSATEALSPSKLVDSLSKVVTKQASSKLSVVFGWLKKLASGLLKLISKIVKPLLTFVSKNFLNLKGFAGSMKVSPQGPSGEKSNGKTMYPPALNIVCT